MNIGSEYVFENDNDRKPNVHYMESYIDELMFKFDNDEVLHDKLLYDDTSSEQHIVKKQKLDNNEASYRTLDQEVIRLTLEKSMLDEEIGVFSRKVQQLESCVARWNVFYMDQVSVEISDLRCENQELKSEIEILKQELQFFRQHTGDIEIYKVDEDDVKRVPCLNEIRGPMVVDLGIVSSETLLHDELQSSSLPKKTVKVFAVVINQSNQRLLFFDKICSNVEEKGIL